LSFRFFRFPAFGQIKLKPEGFNPQLIAAFELSSGKRFRVVPSRRRRNLHINNAFRGAVTLFVQQSYAKFIKPRDEPWQRHRAAGR